ncbi:hypothetical protein D3C81_1760480 [compost metagenome]
MTLIYCGECKNEVSNTALDCNKCGLKLRKPHRAVFGKIIKWSFILFNILMAYWLFAGMEAATEGMSEAQKAGTSIVASFGAFFIFFMWATGDAILGLLVLFTRPSKK